jgi:autotransporter strand-loop-strand O-heptosyltransferase
VNSTKRYFVRFRIEVWVEGKELLVHDYSAKSREVLIQFPVGTLGDSMGWLPYAIKFKEQHSCKLTCAIGEKLIPLFRRAYPEVTFVPHEEVKPERYYATYCMGLFFDDKDGVYQPCDFRHVGLHRTAGYILGVDPTEAPPRIDVGDDKRPIPEPYACIAVQSTTQCKYWNNPYGWRDIVAFLKQAGYRVICIDQKPTHGHGLIWNHIPHGAEDQTGDRPLQERARWLEHAELFVGLSSGLSWLAWACGIPVVLVWGPESRGTDPGVRQKLRAGHEQGLPCSVSLFDRGVSSSRPRICRSAKRSRSQGWPSWLGCHKRQRLQATP